MGSTKQKIMRYAASTIAGVTALAAPMLAPRAEAGPVGTPYVEIT